MAGTDEMGEMEEKAGTEEMGEMAETVVMDTQALAVLILGMVAKRLDGFSHVDEGAHELLMMHGLILITETVTG